MIKAVLLVFLGGGLGSVARFGVSAWLADWYARWPMGTLMSNLLASGLLAATAYYLAKEGADNHWAKWLIMTGFCGGFSTFSTFSLETFNLIRDGQMALAVGNVLVSVVTCLLLVWLVARVYQ